MTPRYNSGLGFAVSLLTGLTICTTSLQAKTPEGGSQGKPKLAHVYQNAHILVNRGEHTVIPLHSVIYLPPKDKSKIVERPSGKFRFWPKFLAKNTQWIWAYEITLDQAKGKKPIPKEKMEEFAKLNRTVIATYKKSPISVRPYKADAPKCR